jgi:stage V sporulation protein B
LKNIHKQTFIQGALILMMANMIVKGIGAIFRIPIFNLIGGEGWAYYQAAYSIYVYFFAISTAGLPIAISRMIAVANMNNNHAEEKKIFRLSLLIFIIVGIIGTSLMALASRSYAEVIGISESYHSILVLAPTLFFVCITAAFRGYFQGKQNMIPTAVSEIIESLGKLIIGVTAALYAIRMGYELYIVAAFTVSGLTVGVFIGVIFLSITKLLMRKAEHTSHTSIKLINNKTENRTDKKDRPEEKKLKTAARKNGEIVREIIKIALPITLSAAILSFSGLVDTFLMTRRLIVAGLPGELAIKIFGEYSAQAISVFNFPNVLVIPFAVSIIPVISMAFADNNKKVIKSTVESTFRVVSIIAMPCAFGIATMSKPILNLLFTNKEAVERIAPMLSILAFAIVLVAMVAVTNSMLQAQKQERKTIVSTGCGIIVKIVASYILIAIPEINRFGTPMSTVLCYFTIMSINFYFLVKYTGIVPPIRRTFIKPFMASSIMAICTILVYMLFNNILNGSRIAVIPAIIIAAGIYAALTLAFKTLTREDVLLLPKGTKIYEAMKKKNLIN